MTLNTPQLKIISIIIADEPTHDYQVYQTVPGTGYIYPLQFYVYVYTFLSVPIYYISPYRIALILLINYYLFTANMTHAQL